MKSFLTWAFTACLFIFISVSAYSQKQIPLCGWQPPSNDPASVLKRQFAEKRIQQMITRNQLEDIDSLYTLPVVVHVIHTGTAVGSPDNPTDAQINAMIQSLNDSWRKNGASFGGVDLKMQFQLALRSPVCGSTTGINRVDGSSVPNYVSGGIGVDNFPGSADQVIVKNLSRWSNTDYINLWIVNKINGSASNTGGFAYFGQYNDAAIDGIVMNALFVNGENKTLSHEMGHVFELYHTFYDDAFQTTCPRVDSCGYYGDRVCDTEGGLLNYVCTNPINSCTGLAYTIADPLQNYTVLNNYMNYTNCAWMFTTGQKERVRAALLAFRPGLINSGALKAAPASSPALACIPTVVNGPSPYYGVERVQFNTIDVYSNTSLGDGNNYVDRSCNQRTTVYKGQTYQLSITGTYLNPHSFKAFMDYNNDGDFDDGGELLLTDYTSIATANILIPSSGVPIGVPLRLRLVADNPEPFLTYPSACQLNGILEEGAGQVEDYAVIIANGPVESISSGAWNNPSTWSCNCVPVSADLVTIKTGHTVTVTQAMGLVEIRQLIVETGGNFTLGTNASFKQQKGN